jgi:hypothetical protein
VDRHKDTPIPEKELKRYEAEEGWMSGNILGALIGGWMQELVPTNSTLTVYVFPTVHHCKMRSVPKPGNAWSEYVFQNVKHFSNADIAKKQLLFHPINYNNVHWILAWIDNRAESVFNVYIVDPGVNNKTSVPRKDMESCATYIAQHFDDVRNTFIPGDKKQRGRVQVIGGAWMQAQNFLCGDFVVEYTGRSVAAALEWGPVLENPQPDEPNAIKWGLLAPIDGLALREQHKSEILLNLEDTCHHEVSRKATPTQASKPGTRGAAIQ